MDFFNEIVEFSSDILYTLGGFCDSIFEFLSYEIDIPFLIGAIGSGSYTVGGLLFSSSVVIILSYKIILSLIPIV